MSWEEFDLNDKPSQSFNSSNNSGGGFQKKQWNGKPNSGFQRKFEEGPAELYLPYTVSANQDIPDNISDILTSVVKRFSEADYTLRTGGNKGVDDLLESLSKRTEIHLPWRGFNDKQSKFTFNTKNSFEIAKQFSPVYENMKDSVKAMLARNVRMMLGKDLKSPTMFLITWTADGAESASERTGKTGFAGHLIAMASAMRVPVYNLSKPNTLDRIQQYLSQ